MFIDSQQQSLSREVILFESLLINVRHLGFFLTVLPRCDTQTTRLSTIGTDTCFNPRLQHMMFFFNFFDCTTCTQKHIALFIAYTVSIPSCDYH